MGHLTTLPRALKSLRTGGSGRTITANAGQQVAAVAVFMSVPLIVTPAEFGQAVFAMTLIALSAIADLGLSQVYGRMAPGLATKDPNGLVEVERALLGFGLVSSGLFAIGIATLHYQEFGAAFDAALLGVAVVATFVSGFAASRASVRSDFELYRNVILARSLGLVSAVPLTALVGVTGWFLAQAIASFFALAVAVRRTPLPRARLDFGFVRRHALEGLQLAAATALWLQLINFSRLYATVHLREAELASVGLVAAAFQSLSTLAISAFLPLSVDLYRRFSRVPGEAMARANAIARLAALPALLAMFVACLAGPPLLSLTFPSYQIDGSAAALIFSSIALFPFFLSWSTALVATERSRVYLVLIGGSLAAGFGAARVAGDAGGAMSAAIGQIVALLCLTLGVWVANFLSAKAEVRWDLAVTLGVLAIVLGTATAGGAFLTGA